MKTISYIELRLMISDSLDSTTGATKILDAYISFPATKLQDVNYSDIVLLLARQLVISAEKWSREAGL